MNIQRMIEWICTHNVGNSSRTMWAALMGVKNVPSNGYIVLNTPFDCDDFSRCHDLVKYCEVNPDLDFPTIINSFPWYEPILRNWDKLSYMYESGDHIGVDGLLSELREEVYIIRRM